MTYQFENIRLEKGMYGRSGHTFTQTLEELDPSEHYRGTPLEGLDAFQRQLKRLTSRLRVPAVIWWKSSSTAPTPRCSSRSSSPV